GWLADRYLGTRWAVGIGGAIIACGHFSLAVPSMPSFYLGLVLISLGTGLLKPNMSAMVGQLYAPGDHRRDAGFSIFYMGINIGALFAPLVCGFLAQSGMFKHLLEHVGMSPHNSWHWGFAAAGVGMVLGLIQYVLSGDRLTGVGLRPLAASHAAREKEPFDAVPLVLAALGAAVGFLIARFTAGAGLVNLLFPTVVGAAFGYVAGVIRRLSRQELWPVLVIFVLFVFSIVFWMSFEQGATSLNLFADRMTRNAVLGHSYPSSWFQAVEPAFVIAMAPVFAWLWVRLGKYDPTPPVKFAFGLVFAGLAFALVAYASTFVRFGLVSPIWLVLVYLLQTLGELCLSPVGLSTVTKLSPPRLAGLLMGFWFLSVSFGDFIAGWSARFVKADSPGQMVHAFGIIALISIAAGLVLFGLTPLINRMLPRDV
ncbi:MAG TPA: oligopeptide:H+ symporter, partial [Tepidisphaeraceae bacterium]|nr:oligopeptide:H+ symporter [Tepidisphaeraceae bacterium]